MKLFNSSVRMLVASKLGLIEAGASQIKSIGTILFSGHEYVARPF